MKTRSVLGRVFLFLCLILLVDAVGAAVVGSIQLRRAAGGLDDAATALRRDEVPAAIAAVERAGAAADSAQGLAEHPGFKLLGWVPGLERDVSAFTALARVSGLGASAADRVVTTLVGIGAAEGGIIDSLYGDGSVDLAAMDEIARVSNEASADIDSARTELEDESASIGPLDAALDRAAIRLDAIAEVTARGQKVASVLPGLLGADGPRRYLLAFQSPSEARGGGGLIGVYGMLSARGGRVSLGGVGPIEDLGPVVRPPVEAPTAFTRLYGPLSALQDWRQANLSPTFPATSSVLLDMYERVRGERLDGVIAMDPLALGELTRGTGPLEGAGWNKTITRNNARRLLLFRIYKHFVHRETEQNIYLRDLVASSWGRIESGELNAAGLVTGLNNAVAKHHLKVYSEDPGEQALLVELGAAGDPSAIDGPLQSVFNNNNSGNKLDFFLHRHQQIEITLDEDGGAEVQTAVRLSNEVPRKGLRAAGRAGVDSGLELGENRMSLHFMLPEGARPGRFTIDGRKSPSYSGSDAGRPVEWAVVQVAPDEMVVAAIGYRVPDLLTGGDPRLFRFTLWPQATARPDSYELIVRAPAGHLLVGARGSAEASLTLEGVLKEPLAVSLRVLRAERG